MIEYPIMNGMEYDIEVKRRLAVYSAQTKQLEGAYEKDSAVSWRKHPLSPLTPLFLSHLATNLVRTTDGETPRPRVIDLGCGAGEKTNKLRWFSIDVVGIDYLHGAITTANVTAQNEVLDSSVCLVQGDLVDLPFRDGTFDGAHDYLAFLHIMREDWDKYITSVHRILKKGAPLLVVTFSGNDPDFYGYPVNRLEKREIVFSDEYYQGDTNSVAHLVNSYFYFPTERELGVAFAGRFEVLDMVEIPHPLHRNSPDHVNRKLWHTVFRKM